MINWDVKAKTAFSDEEVIFKEMQSKLYYLRYALEWILQNNISPSPPFVRKP